MQQNSTEKLLKILIIERSAISTTLVTEVQFLQSFSRFCFCWEEAPFIGPVYRPLWDQGTYARMQLIIYLFSYVSRAIHLTLGYIDILSRCFRIVTYAKEI